VREKPHDPGADPGLAVQCVIFAACIRVPVTARNAGLGADALPHLHSALSPAGILDKLAAAKY
jgi:hypothetical protein